MGVKSMRYVNVHSRSSVACALGPRDLIGSTRHHSPRDVGFPFPAPGDRVEIGLDGKNRLRQREAVLEPGTYDGLEISAGSVVRLKPGIYLFTGDLVIRESRLLGEDVLLAFSRARFWMQRRADVRLTSPRSGTFANVQFIEDPHHLAGDSWISIGCEATLEYDGMMLFPNSSIWIFDGAVVRGTEAIGGQTFWLQSGCDVAVRWRTGRGAADVGATPIPMH
jgi:hypothetical protein